MNIIKKEYAWVRPNREDEIITSMKSSTCNLPIEEDGSLSQGQCKEQEEEELSELYTQIKQEIQNIGLKEEDVSAYLMDYIASHKEEAKANTAFLKLINPSIDDN